MKIIMLLIFLSISCSEATKKSGHEYKNIANLNSEKVESKETKIQNEEIVGENLQYEYEVLEEIPHDINAYTQGYIFKNGILYESTGQFGSSTLRKVNPKTGQVIQKISVGFRYFAEGIEMYNDKIYLLTWKNNICKVFDAVNLGEIGEYRFSGEGWGLCLINDKFYMSNGTNLLQIIDPKTFSVVNTLSVNDQDGFPLMDLNELEFAKGFIFANIWMTDRIAVINPNTGLVVNIIDFHPLRKRLKNNSSAETFNGIAYNEEEDIFYLTGKNWSKTFKVRIF